ncbi:MAG: hypothetical protein ACTSXQ_06105 [Alphaproteobacteria bacterium]
MQVKMIRDLGAFKKGQTYNLNEKKAVTLLTDGFCVRVKANDNAPSATKKKKK